MLNVATPEHETEIQSEGGVSLPHSSSNDKIIINHLLLHLQRIIEHDLQGVALLWQQSPVERVSLVGALYRVRLVGHDVGVEGGRWVQVRVE